MLSRVADAIYWAARYIERAENVARFVDVNLQLTLDLRMMDKEQWAPLVTVTGDHAVFAERYGEATQESVIRFLTFDPDYPNSIYSCIRAARENARSVREIISSEMWEALNRFYLLVKDADPEAVLDEPHEFFETVKRRSHLFTGLAEDTMTHGEGWHFLRLGQRLERADKTSRMLDVKYFILLPDVDYVGTPYDNIQWAAVLRSASSLEMYRKRFNRIIPRQVADFLIFDIDFPRAIRYCVVTAESSLHTITGAPAGSFRTEAEKRLGRLRAELDYTGIDEVMRIGMHEYLDELQLKLNHVSDAIFETFFALRPAVPDSASIRGDA